MAMQQYVMNAEPSLIKEVDAIINKKLEELNAFKDKEYHKVDIRSEFLDVVQFEEE